MIKCWYGLIVLITQHNKKKTLDSYWDQWFGKDFLYKSHRSAKSHLNKFLPNNSLFLWEIRVGEYKWHLKGVLGDTFEEKTSCLWPPLWTDSLFFTKNYVYLRKHPLPAMYCSLPYEKYKKWVVQPCCAMITEI